MRILITGAGGFVGRYLIGELLAHDHEPVCFDLAPPPAGMRTPDVRWLTGDLADEPLLRRILTEIKPDGCIHLAALTFVPLGWTQPAKMFAVNLGGTVNLLTALQNTSPRTRLLLISSAEVYGRVPSPAPLKEDAPLCPDNPYALSKSAAEQMALMYGSRYDMPVLTARPCNHIGPGQSGNFVVPAFAAQLRDIAAGRESPEMKVGNLDSRRVFLDVRDVVRAYRCLLEMGTPGGTYNIAGADELPIRIILEKLCLFAGVQPTIGIDPALFRPADRRPLLDASRMERELDWRPVIPLDQTLRDIITAG